MVAPGQRLPDSWHHATAPQHSTAHWGQALGPYRVANARLKAPRHGTHGITHREEEDVQHTHRQRLQREGIRHQPGVALGHPCPCPAATLKSATPAVRALPARPLLRSRQLQPGVRDRHAAGPARAPQPPGAGRVPRRVRAALPTLRSRWKPSQRPLSTAALSPCRASHGAAHRRQCQLGAAWRSPRAASATGSGAARARARHCVCGARQDGQYAVGPLPHVLPCGREGALPQPSRPKQRPALTTAASAAQSPTSSFTA